MQYAPSSAPYGSAFEDRHPPQPQADFQRCGDLRFVFFGGHFSCVFSPAVRATLAAFFSSVFGGFFACKTAYKLVFLLHIRGDNLWASSYVVREVFLRLFHCCFGVFSLLCGLFQGGTALQTLCFCPIYPLLHLSLAYPLSWVPSLPEDTFSRRFLALSYTLSEIHLCSLNPSTLLSLHGYPISTDLFRLLQVGWSQLSDLEDEGDMIYLYSAPLVIMILW